MSARVRIDQRLALASIDILAGIIAARLSTFAGFDAVQHRSGRTARPPDALAVHHEQRMVDLLEQFAVAPQGEPTADRALVRRQQPPGNPAQGTISTRRSGRAAARSHGTESRLTVI